MKTIAFSGSLRRDSYTRRLIHVMDGLFPDGFSVRESDLAEIPLYNADLDGEGRPESVNRLVKGIEEADALLFVVPEYNYSIPGVLKNALDWASRPAYKSCLAHKPAAMMAASPGFVGGARALAHLRQILGGTLTEVFPYPEVLVNAVSRKFGEKGLEDEQTREHLQKFAEAFAAWVAKRS